MRILIVEDEPLLAKQLKNILFELEPGYTVTGICYSVRQTIKQLQQLPQPDLILMDIELADGQSFEVFQQVEVISPVIFITAYDEFAIKAFKLNSIDYLLKPVSKEDIKAALQKFHRTQKRYGIPESIQAMLSEIQKLQQQAQGYRERFLIKTGSKMISIDVEDIAYFISENGLTFLHTHHQKYILDYTLDELQNMLSPKQFFRANRKCILNSKSVVAIRSWFNQKLVVEVKPAMEEQVIVSREKAGLFRSWLGE